MRPLRSSLLLLASLAAAGSAAMLVNCAPAEEEAADETDDAITGVNNTLGLGLAYDSSTSNVLATVKKPLGQGEKLFVRVRRGTITHDSQAKLDCGQLSEAAPITRGENVSNGKVVYQGPSVSKELIDVLSIYNDVRWQAGNATPDMRAEIEKGPDAIVEACVLENGKVKAKLLTNLAYAWDRGEDLKKQAGNANTRSIHLLAGDAGAASGPTGPGQIDDGRDGGAPEAGPTTLLPEGQVYNTIDYANLCVQELGEIPFFKKLADGKYETFDCRDFVGSNGDQPGGRIEGVESAIVPLTVDDQPQTECSPGRSSVRTFDCVDKCDRAEWATAPAERAGKASCQPGVTVSSAKNERGSHWVLLCRKVESTNGASMMATKTFNDIAIVGTNPKTGKTCFFQNKEDVGNDGSRITHPGDVARSSATWTSTPPNYCANSCHGADAFIHSPWLDQAKRSDGHTIVPKLGELRDFAISTLDAPYSVVNGDAQGFRQPKQLVSEEVAACTTCHRVAGAAFADFAEWSTGTGEPYFSKVTDRYKAFEKSHWMPMRLEGLSAATFEFSKWGLAVKHIRKCTDNPNADGCVFADVPRQ